LKTCAKKFQQSTMKIPRTNQRGESGTLKEDVMGGLLIKKESAFWAKKK